MKKPKDTLEDMILLSMLMSPRRKPGEISKYLNKEQKESIQKLRSKDIKNVRWPG